MTRFSRDMDSGTSFWFDRLRNARNVMNAEKVVVGWRRSLKWAAAGLLFVGFLLGFDLISEILGDGITVVLEVVEENLESTYVKLFELDHYHAQMATAYTGFLALLVAGYLMFRKFRAIWRDVLDGLINKLEKFREFSDKQWQDLIKRWESMDAVNKIFAAVGLFLAALPLVAIMCYAFGVAIAEMV